MPGNFEPTGNIADRIDALLGFLPVMEARVAGEWQGGDRNEDGSINMPWMSYDERVLAFIKACYQHGWVRPFDWNAWQEQAKRYYDDPLLLAAADLTALQKLLTLHVRKERFHEGHLAGMIESGHLALILRRLEVIRRAY